MADGLSRASMRRLVTLVNNEEYARIVAYAKRRRLSLYGLLKEALFEYLQKHP